MTREPPLVLLHGFMDTPRAWERVLPALARHHEVITPTALSPDDVERAMDQAKVGTAHLVGNSLGGFLALKLAERGRARSVVALAPAGGWAPGDPSRRALFDLQRRLHEQVRSLAPHADAIAATPEGRRRATALIAEHGENLSPDLVADLILAAARLEAAPQLIDQAMASDWELDAERITCPVRIVWGTADRLLPWPSAAARFRSEWLPNADWVELDGVGHAPQLDAPVETAQLIAGLTNAASFR